MIQNQGRHKQAFTLIELSIVLVIIGLIVGGVLVGRDLITAAEARAQVAQIEQYQTAVITFRGKYNNLPGDIVATEANRFGFTLDDNGNGGDGDFIIKNGIVGEPNLFWIQLAEAKLIKDVVNRANWYGVSATGSQIVSYLPKAKVGGNMYISAWNGGWSTGHPAGSVPGVNGINYFGLYDWYVYCHNWCNSSVGFSMRVTTAYAIDVKADDGLPQSGNILALVFDPGYGATWAGSSDYGAGWHQPPPDGGPTTAPGAASATSCYDNGNTTGVMRYSLSTNNGMGTNCALSFRFQ